MYKDKLTQFLSPTESKRPKVNEIGGLKASWKATLHPQRKGATSQSQVVSSGEETFMDIGLEDVDASGEFGKDETAEVLESQRASKSQNKITKLESKVWILLMNDHVLIAC